MKNTRFMTRLFSATEEGDVELTDSVARDIEDARELGVVDTDEVIYEADQDGRVIITDKETGEQTVAEKASEDDETYDLSHPAHWLPSPNLDNYLFTGNYNDIPCEGCEDEEYINQEESDEMEEKEFSIHTDNQVVQRVFSDQEFCERIFAEVIESEETAIVGDLKVERDPEEENTVVVTSETTGDQAKITLDEDEMEVTELEAKAFSEEAYEPYYVVAVDAANNTIFDAPAYTLDSANELVLKLNNMGMSGARIIESQEEAQAYAMELLVGLGVHPNLIAESIEEPEQVQFSDCVINATRYFSDNTEFMARLFSEAVDGKKSESQEDIEEAIENGEEIETATEIITPVDEETAVIETKGTGEFTKATLDGEDMQLDAISKYEAKELVEDLVVAEEVEDEEDERTYSYYGEPTYYTERLFTGESTLEDIEEAIEEGEEIETVSEVITPVDEYMAVIEDKQTGEFTKAVIGADGEIHLGEIDQEEAEELVEDVVVAGDVDERNFSYYEPSETYYMTRLFSGDADSEDIVEAIEEGEEIETPEEIITPVDEETAVVEDKQTGEFTMATLDEEGEIHVEEIDRSEAEELVEDIAVAEEVEDEGEEGEKKFSAYYDEFGDYQTSYMTRLFSEDSELSDIEDAIEDGEEIETATEIITPVDEETAVIEDKETGEFTKAVMDGEDVEVKPITEEEAHELIEDIVVAEEVDEEDLEKEAAREEEKKYSHPLQRFFNEMQNPQPQQQQQQDPNQQPQEEQGPSIEEVEDRAAAIAEGLKQLTQEMGATIEAAKNQTAEGQDDLREAQFSQAEQRTFSNGSDTLASWLSGNI